MNPGTTTPASAASATTALERSALPAPGSARAWWLAVRPATLSAAVAPVAVGTALASRAGAADAAIAALCLATALALQVTANLANDVFDFERGADGAERVGPPRAAASGLLTPTQLRVGTAVAAMLSALSGLGLVALGGWPIAVLGVLSIAAALAYTAGPAPLAWHALGDVTTFVFFGPVAVVGSCFVQGGGAPPLAFVAAIPVGALVTAILVVNNLRDIEGDRRVGKRTLAVRIGDRATRALFASLLVTAFIVPIALVVSRVTSPVALLPLVLGPAALRLARAVSQTRGAALNPLLGATARLALGFSLCFAAGLAA